jgi:hypothetical protein
MIRASFICTVPCTVKNVWSVIVDLHDDRNKDSRDNKIKFIFISVQVSSHTIYTALHNTSPVQWDHLYQIVIKCYRDTTIYHRASGLGSGYNVWCCVPHTNSNTVGVGAFNYVTENVNTDIIFNIKIFTSTTVQYCVEITTETSSENKARLHWHDNNRNLDIMIIKQKPALLKKVARLCIFRYETYFTNKIHKRVTNSVLLKQRNRKYNLFPKRSLFGVW